MRILVVLIALAFNITSCGSDSKKSKPGPLIVSETPKKLGPCDVDYSALKVENLDKHKIIVRDEGMLPLQKIIKLNELNSVPDIFLSVIGEQKIPYHVTTGNVTDFEDLKELKNQSVVLENGARWEEISGLVTQKGVFLSSSNSIGKSLSIHETGHVIDSLWDLTSSEHLSEIFKFYTVNKPQIKFDRDQDYRFLNIREFFAMGFDDFYCSQQSRTNLARLYPMMHGYFETEIFDEIKSRPIQENFRSQL